MKTEQIYYRKKNKEGKFIYDKKKNDIMNNLLKKNKFLFYYDRKIEQQQTNIIVKGMKGYNKNGNMIIKTDKKIKKDTAILFGIDFFVDEFENSNMVYIVEKHHREKQYEEDLNGLLKGIYSPDMNLLTYKSVIKEYENLHIIAKKTGNEVETLYELNKDYDASLSFFPDIINKDNMMIAELNIPIPSNKIYIKKLKKDGKNLKQIIHTYIMLNGLNQTEFNDLYFSEIKNHHSFLKITTYKNDKLNDIWREVSLAIKNKTDLHKKFLSGDITTTDYIFNLEIITDTKEYKELITLKEQSKFIADYKRKCIHKNIKKINELKVVKYSEKNPGTTLKELSQILKVGERTLKTIKKKYNLSLSSSTSNKKNKVIEVYNWMIMMDFKPSIKAIIDASTTRTTLEIKDEDGNTIKHKDKYEKMSQNSVKKYLKGYEIFTDKDYQTSYSEKKSMFTEKAEPTKKHNFDIDDDEFDFWSGGDEFIKDLDNEELVDKTEDINSEYNAFVSQRIYKSRRIRYAEELKIMDEFILDVYKNDMKKPFEEIDWDAKDESFLIKNGLTLKQVYDRITEEYSLELGKELKEFNKNNKELPKKKVVKTELDEQLDDIFDME